MRRPSLRRASSRCAAHLDRIDAIASVDDARALAPRPPTEGIGAFFGIGVEADFEDATVYLAYVGARRPRVARAELLPGHDERSVVDPCGVPVRMSRRSSATSAVAMPRPLPPTRSSRSRPGWRLPHCPANSSVIPADHEPVRVDGLDGLMPHWGLDGVRPGPRCHADTVSVDIPDFFRALERPSRRPPSIPCATSCAGTSSVPVRRPWHPPSRMSTSRSSGGSWVASRSSSRAGSASSTSPPRMSGMRWPSCSCARRSRRRRSCG